MRGESHRRLGKYLVQRYMSNIPEACINAFLIGCIQPDRNPATYLKGSFREQWLRGHNYRNARHFMRRISRRLEKKTKWTIFDYYTLGKLIHYTADAFTSAHNECFPTDLSVHQQYEHTLQDYFLDYLRGEPAVNIRFAESVMDAIQIYHREYRISCGDIHRDSSFALSACCCILMILLTKPIL